MAVGNGVAVGIGGVVGTTVAVGGGAVVAVGGGAAVAVGVDVAPAGAGVSMVMTAGVAVGSAALLGGAVAVAGELGVGVGFTTITRGVGVAVASPVAVGNARGVTVDCIARIAPRVCSSKGVALPAMGATTLRPVMAIAAINPVTTTCRRVGDVTALGTVLQSWRPGEGSTIRLFASWSRLALTQGAVKISSCVALPGSVCTWAMISTGSPTRSTSSMV